MIDGVLFRSNVPSFPPSVDKGSMMLDELPEGRVESERPEVGDVVREESLVEIFPEGEVDERAKVTGTFPRASGSRPTPLATVSLKLSVFWTRLAAITGERRGDYAP